MFTRSAHRFAFLILVAMLLVVAPRALAQDTPETIQLVGTIEAVNANTITVNQVLVNITDAEVKTTLEVGLKVKVQGTLLDDGTVQASEVEAVDQGLLPGEVKITGTLESLTATTAVVNGLTFDITTAEVEAGLQAGDLVEVHASPAEDGTWIAREISHHEVGSNSNSTDDSSTDTHTEDFEIIGTLERVGSGVIVVAGQTINTQNARIEGMLVIGTLVKAEVTLVEGELIASKVESYTGSTDDSGTDNSGVCQFEIESGSANLRSGPGTGYDVLGYAYEGDEYPITAVDTTGSWLQVTANVGDAWVAASVGHLSSDCTGLSVSTLPYIDGGSSVDDSNHDANDDHSTDDSNHDANDDYGTDDSNHDSNDDYGTDDSNHDSNDDHGTDDSNHDSGDDHGTDDSNHDSGDDHGSDD